MGSHTFISMRADAASTQFKIPFYLDIVINKKNKTKLV